MQKILRRPAIGLALAAVVLALLVGGWLLLMPGGGVSGQQKAAVPQAAGDAAVLQVLPRDHVLGKAEAPITIVEYASLTCSHCAHFHREVLPAIKAKWIDSGKAKLVYRDFPLDRNALQAAQVAECAGKDRYFAILDLMFQMQDKWAGAPDVAVELGRALRLAGIGEAEVRACIADDKRMTESVLADRESGDKAGVSATPTLFINGRLYSGNRSVAELDAFLEKLGK